MLGLAPYDALMDTSASVAPPHVVKPFQLLPFRALTLNPASVGNPASARAFARPYRQVPHRVREWQRSGRMSRADDPAIYLHEYTASGVTIRGLVGALDVSRTSATCPDADQAVFPHEGVHPDQVRDLAERMHQMRVNPAPILLVHRGPADVRRLVAATIEATPTWAFTDRAEQVHRVWALRDAERLAVLTTGLADTRALIADGHHRYAGYLQLQRDHPGTAWDRGLAMLVDQSDTPLWLGPIHRFVAGESFDTLLERLSTRTDLDCRVSSRWETLEHLGGETMVLTDDERWATVRLRDRERLAVSVLSEELFPALGIAPTRVSFHHTAEDALARARTRAGVCMLMPVPSFDAVVRTAGTGHLLPEKATSFQPKPSLGALMRNLRVE